MEIDFISKYAGGIFATVFFLLMGYLFYWLIVVVPRRVKKIYTEMTTKGYSLIETDDPTINNILNLLAPIFPIDPRIKETIPMWTCRNIAMIEKKNLKKIIINASRLNKDRVLRGGSDSGSTSRTTTILIEKIELPFNAECHLVPCRNTSLIKWKERHGLQQVTSELGSDLLMHYEVYTKSGQIEDISSALNKALIQVCPILIDRSRFCFQSGVSIKFGSNGWGICTSNAIYKKEDMNILIDVADILHRSL